ncbi:MAG: ferritin family protein [Candidatus Omnitrophica bacterium]|nr:ferritin family protein [Candidatus Omnitrophota bacterium]
MANIFSGSEIVELGIQIEKNGRDFYNQLVKQTKNDKARGIFAFLVGEEEKHIEVFKNILKTVENYEPAESYPGEYFAYMNALAGGYVFTQKEKGLETARAIKSDKEAVEKGIGFEKDSIIFYEGMKRAVPQNDIKVVELLIKQEEGHLLKLTELKNML